MAKAFLLQYNNVFKINSTPSAQTPTWLTIGSGITEVEAENGDEIDTNYYYDGQGNAESDVIGMQKVLTFSGHRDYDDAAQNYIMALANVLGPQRRTTFEWTFPDGDKLTGSVTVANIKEPGGAANSKGEIEFEIHFNGKPTYTPAP